MDWTGGVRKRFARYNTKETTAQKQKAHFARQRAQVHVQPSQDRTVPILHYTRGTRSTGTRSRSNHFSVEGFDVVPEPHARTPELDARMSEVETPFSTHRRRLLARRDWLSLSVLKPLRIEFPRDCGKERIGKRRKITRSTVPNDRQEHILHPIPGAFTSKHLDALPPNGINVVVGTQAFTDSTSRASIVAHSTSSLASLSEESMLLGDNEIDLQPHFLPSTLDFELSSPPTHRDSLNYMPHSNVTQQQIIADGHGNLLNDNSFDRDESSFRSEKSHSRLTDSTRYPQTPRCRTKSRSYASVGDEESTWRQFMTAHRRSSCASTGSPSCVSIASRMLLEPVSTQQSPRSDIADL